MEYLAEYNRLVKVGPSLAEKAAEPMLDVLSKAFSTKVRRADLGFLRYRKVGKGVELADKAERLGGILTSVEPEEANPSELITYLKKHGAKPMKAEKQEESTRYVVMRGDEAEAVYKIKDTGNQRWVFVVKTSDGGKTWKKVRGFDDYKYTGFRDAYAWLDKQPGLKRMGKLSSVPHWLGKEESLGETQDLMVGQAVQGTVQGLYDSVVRGAYCCPASGAGWHVLFVPTGKDDPKPRKVVAHNVSAIQGKPAANLVKAAKRWAEKVRAGRERFLKKSSVSEAEGTTPFVTGTAKIDAAVRWLVSKASKRVLPDGTVTYFFQGVLPGRMVDLFSRKTPGFTYRDTGKSVILNWSKGDAHFSVERGAYKSTQNSVAFRAVDERVPAATSRGESLGEAGLGLAALMALGDQGGAEDEAGEQIVASFKKNLRRWTDHLEGITGTSWKADVGEVTVDFREAFGKRRSIGVYWDYDVGSRKVTFYIEGPRGGTVVIPRKGITDPGKPEAPKEFFRRVEQALREALEVGRGGALAESDVGRVALKQFGGHRALVMLGGKASLIHNGFGIRWPNKQRSKGNYVEVTLTPDDTYDMEFFNVSGASKKSVKKYEGLYADALKRTFETWTGRYLSLGRPPKTEARFKDVRQHQQRGESEAQVAKRFKVVQQALGDLESALRSGSPAEAREVEHLSGLLRGVEKRLRTR